MNLKRIFVALLLIGAMATVKTAQSDVRLDGSDAKSPVGSWIVTLTPDDPGMQPPFKALASFTKDGCLRDRGRETTLPRQARRSYLLSMVSGRKLESGPSPTHSYSLAISRMEVSQA